MSTPAPEKRAGRRTARQRTARELTKVYGDELTRRRLGSITTEIRPATDADYFYAEDHHQQYLVKNPGGYCPLHATGVAYEG